MFTSRNWRAGGLDHEKVSYNHRKRKRWATRSLSHPVNFKIYHKYIYALYKFPSIQCLLELDRRWPQRSPLSQNMIGIVERQYWKSRACNKRPEHAATWGWVQGCQDWNGAVSITEHMKDIIPNSDNGVISSSYREGNSCFPAYKHPEKYDVSCDREYEWFPTVIFDHCSYANFRTGSMSLSSATSNTHSWIFRLILSWASTWNWWSRYWVGHRRLSGAFLRRTRVPSWMSQNHAAPLSRESSLEITTISKSIVAHCIWFRRFQN